MTHPQKPSNASLPATYRLGAATGVLLLLGACSAAAHAPTAPMWPEPQQAKWPADTVASKRPGFHAPSATHCARPIQTREVPGLVAGQTQGHAGWRDRLSKAGAPAPSSGPDATVALSAEAPPSLASGRAGGTLERRPAPSTVAPAAPGRAAERQALAAPWPEHRPQAQAQPPAVVTAGVVDDNADFSAYLAFRDRTSVPHRARDIRERHLLAVRDHAGRGVPDAEVVVRGSSGHMMWARTDTAGRVWLHPNAFDPGDSAHYDVRVRKAGHHGQARLQRGQKSAVEVRLPTDGAVPARSRLDLVFLIDATGSMADEIGKLKATLRTIAAEVAALPSQPDLCFGLVAYRDRGDAFLLRSHDFTNDLGAFQGVLNALQARGGGDYPEALNEAMHETVHNLSWRDDGATRMVVLLADAPPHLDYGGPQYDNDMMAALGKGIKVFSVGASGLDRQGEFVQRQIAQYTGGRFVFLTYAQADQPGSGPGRETVHDVTNYSVETLDRLVVRLVAEELQNLPHGR